jgi:uncharacterized protein (DUF58 family)
VAVDAVRYGDKVGLLLYDSETRAAVTPQGGAAALGRIARVLAGAESRLVESDHLAALTWAVEAAGRRSLVVWFADLSTAATHEEIMPYLAQVSHRHMVLQVEVPRRRSPAAADLWLAAGEAVLDKSAARVRGHLRASGVVTVVGRDVASAAVMSYRVAKERGAR